MLLVIHVFEFQDSSKVEALVKECEESTNMIPKLEDTIPKLQKLLLDEDKVLEEIKESSKGVHCIFLCVKYKFFFFFF